MPFDIIPPVLGVCFATAWVFIGGMLIRDSLDHARRYRVDSPSDPPVRHLY